MSYQKPITPEYKMNEDTIRDFNRDGAVCLRQFLNAEEIAILKEGIEFNLSSLSARAKIASRHDDPGYFVEDFVLGKTILFINELSLVRIWE